jgi:hypothetical protein
MSNLNSKFDVLAGLPPHGRSALDGNFKQKAAESPIMIEGMIGKIEDESGVPVLTKLTSGDVTDPPDFPWLVLQGMDQSDAAFVDKMTALSVKSGVIWRVETAVSFTIGDRVYANAGVVAKVAGTEQDIGQAIGVDSAAGTVDIASAW